jgi:hypothetical protein
MVMSVTFKRLAVGGRRSTDSPLSLSHGRLKMDSRYLDLWLFSTGDDSAFFAHRVLILLSRSGLPTMFTRLPVYRIFGSHGRTDRTETKHPCYMLL